MHRQTTFILVVLVLLVAVAAVARWPVTSPSSVKSPRLEVVDSFEASVYTSNEYGFSFRYPASWNLADDLAGSRKVSMDNGDIYDSVGVRLHVSSNPTEVGVPPSDSRTRIEVIGDHRVTIRYGLPSYGPAFDTYNIPLGEMWLIFVAAREPENESTIRSIIRSLTPSGD